MFLTFRLKKAACGAAALGMAAAVGLGLGMRSLAAAAGAGKEELAPNLPIIMYHGILKEEKRQGKFVISPREFESDLQYLQENGYNTIVMQDLIDYVYEGKELPANPIMLTFDDGYYNDVVYAFPLLKQYNSKMVFSPIGRYTDQYSKMEDRHANYAHATWADIREMMDSGLVEVQNHTYDMHTNGKQRKGAMMAKGETIDHYRQALMADVFKMQQAVEKNTGVVPTTFTYPFGAISKESLPILKELGFKATLICESRVNRITRDPQCLYGLGRYLRPSGISSEQYFTQTVGLGN